MEQMKVSQYVSCILDMQENITWKNTYRFQRIPMLDEETYNGDNMECVIRRIKLHKQWNLLLEISRLAENAIVHGHAGDKTDLYGFFTNHVMLQLE